MTKEIRPLNTTTKRILRLVSSIIAFLFGFSTSIQAQYGVMEVDYQIKGNVISEESNKGIPDIMLTVVEESVYYPADTFIFRTDSNGTFAIPGNFRPDIKLSIKVEDVDGLENQGEFEVKTENYSFNHSDFINNGESGHWSFTRVLKDPLIIYLKEDKEQQPAELPLPLPEEAVLPENFDITPDHEPEVDNVISPEADSVLSDGIIATNEITTSEAPQLLNVFPNPSKSNVSIEFTCTEAIEVELSVVDSRGRLVYNSQFNTVLGKNKTTIDLSDIASGIYIISLSGREFFESAQIIKN